MSAPAFRPATAMVFAAGLGTRMRPVTDTMPKPLVEVGGRALIDHMLDRLAEAKVGTAVINVHYKPEQIIRHVAARREPRIVISDESDRLLDQGGGIIKARETLGRAPFLICNTDALWIEGGRGNLDRLFQFWDPAKMDILLLVASASHAIGVDWPGDFTMDSDGRLAKREERQVAPFVYAGVGVMKPELFDTETRDIFRLAPYFFDAAERGRLYGLRLDGIWLHVGTPQAIADAEGAMARSIR